MHPLNWKTVALLAVSLNASAETYSPYGEDERPYRVLWGDTHLHTNLSLDARSLGVELGPEEAYRFARGEVVKATQGEKVRLSRPLDFLVVSDHSDGLGAMNEIIKGNERLLGDPMIKDWHDRMKVDTSTETVSDIITTFTSGDIPDVLKDVAFNQSIWDRYLDTAERFNDPGQFTTLIGYEWTSTEGGNNLHRNVLYRGGREAASQMLPFTTYESLNPEGLWQWLENYEAKTGSEAFALAHNGNLSNGLMFPVETNPATGKPLTGDYAVKRARWEPLYEITQIKGDGESHPFLSPNDEYAGHDALWDKTNLGPVPKDRSMLQYEYAREALKNGLKLEADLGTNPYKFGVIGSTDSHTGLSTGSEENYFGKHTQVEPSAERQTLRAGALFGETRLMNWEYLASGYAAVWAQENTREAIFDAMKRKEVYATTGPRMTVWFFGGWDFEPADLDERTPGIVGRTKGVPMGGELTAAPRGKAPTFLVAALKDPLRGNLDRAQVVKGWLDADGNTHERVFDVAWSDPKERRPDADGRVPDVGNSVDVASATWTNSIGAPELATVWTDPEFDPSFQAFYYVRVIEIPTPRWTAYDAKRFGFEPNAEVPMTVRDRAYTSAIWYSPLR